MINKKTKGFTLVEVLVTISMMVILSSIIIPRYEAYKEKSLTKKALYIAKEINTVAMTSFSQEGGVFIHDEIQSLLQRATELKPASGDINVDSSDPTMVTIGYNSDGKTYSIKISAKSDYKVFYSGSIIYYENETT